MNLITIPMSSFVKKLDTLPPFMQGLLATLLALAAGAVINMAALATMPGLLSLLAGYRYGKRLSAHARGILCGVGVWLVAGLQPGATAGAALVMIPIHLVVTLVTGRGACALGERIAATER